MVFYKNMNTSVSIKILLLLVESENSITREKISSCLAQNPRFKFDEFWHLELEAVYLKITKSNNVTTEYSVFSWNSM